MIIRLCNDVSWEVIDECLMKCFYKLIGLQDNKIIMLLWALVGLYGLWHEYMSYDSI